MSDQSDVMRSLISVLCLASGTPLLAAPPDAENKEAKKIVASPFLRIQRTARNQPVALETATVRYVPASGEGGLTVDLVGVVHIGDRAYYRNLNKQLAQYD